MKAKTKLHKLLSLLLALVMVVGLLPAMSLTAYAEEVYPDAYQVFINEKAFNTTLLYYTNGAESAGSLADNPNWNAHYDPTTGILELNNFDDGYIRVGGAVKKDITIKLTGTNKITTTSAYGIWNTNGGDITITADSKATLEINVNNSETVAGISADTGSAHTTGSVTLQGYADVIVKANTTGEYKYAYGIIGYVNASIIENASFKAICRGTNKGYGYGIYSTGGVTIATNGAIDIDVTGCTGPNSVFCIGGTHAHTLTKVGKGILKYPSDGGAIAPASSEFSESTHAINKDPINCVESYRYGTPYTVTVESGMADVYGLMNKQSAQFVKGDTVTVTANTISDLTFKKWTSADVTVADATNETTTFTMPDKDVTVTANYNLFTTEPSFTKTSDTQGTISFTLAATPSSAPKLVEKNSDTVVGSTYFYGSTLDRSQTVRDGSGAYNVPAGEYRIAVKYGDTWMYSDVFTVSYTATPAGNYPDHVRVYNGSGTITSLSDGQCLVTNDGSATSYTGGTSYVARYEKSSGTLYLKDYHGAAADGQIYATGDLNIAVESNSSFTTSVSASNNLYGIQADGKLNISGSGKLTVTANGDGDVYGIYANKGVTISAPLVVNVGKKDSSKNGPLYGIYTKSGAISLSGADMTVTATGGTSTVYGVFNAADTPAIADNGNITISGKLTVSLSNGSYNRGISSQGGDITLNGATVKIPGSYYYGIYNNNGNVVIKSTSDVDISSDISYNNGICTDTGGDLTIQNSTVKVSADGYAANLVYGKLSINNSIVALTRNAETYRVVETSSGAANTIDLSGSGTVTLTASGNQSGSSMIGGTVSITTPGTKLEKGKHYPSLGTYDGEYDGSSKTVLQFVHEAPAPATYTVSFDANGGTGTMADVTGVSGDYVLPENGFTAPDGNHFKCWSVGGVEKAVGDTINVTANTTVIAQWTTMLDKPTNLVWNGTTAKWDAVTGANKYRVILYASTSGYSGSIIFNNDLEANSKDFSEYMLPGMYYYFEVAAYDSAHYSETFSGFNSSAKKQMLGSIGTVTGFAWSGNTISWTAVEGATGYDVWVMKDGVQKDSVRNVSGTSLDLTSDFESGEGTYYVSVSAYKLARGNYLAKGNSPAKIIGATPVISAAVGNVTVNGTVGTAITETQVAVDLTNDTFESNLSGNWITNLPAGLSQSVSYGGTTRAIITISGTPTAASTEQIAITIPEDQLIVNTEDLTVTANANAKFNISAAETYTVSGTATSFGSETDNVILQLIAEGYSEADYEVFVKGNTASYSISNVEPGTYTMKVMKAGHATETYSVIVGTGNLTQNVALYMMGDVNKSGTITVTDANWIRQYVVGSREFDEQQIRIADVNNSGGTKPITVTDANWVRQRVIGARDSLYKPVL